MRSFLPCLAITFVAAAMLPSSALAARFFVKSFSCAETDSHCVFMSNDAFAVGPPTTGDIDIRCAVANNGNGFVRCQFPDTTSARIQCVGKPGSYIDAQFGQISAFQQYGKAIGEWSGPNNGVETYQAGADLTIKCLP